MKKTLSLLVTVLALAGCGSAETKEESSRKDPVVSAIAQDAPPAEESTAPPFGTPKQKVSPSSLDKPTDSLTHDSPPH